MQLQEVQNSSNLSYFISTKNAKPTISTRTLKQISLARSMSTRTMKKCLNDLSKDELSNVESMQMGTPILLALAKIILGLQYS